MMKLQKYMARTKPYADPAYDPRIIAMGFYDKKGQAFISNFDNPDVDASDGYKNAPLVMSPDALLNNIEMKRVFEKSEEVMWQCRECGHLVIGKQAPEICPVCAHPQSYQQVRAENY